MTLLRRKLAVAILALACAMLAACGGGSSPTPPEPGNAKFAKMPYLMYSGDNSKMTVLWQADSTPAATTIAWGTTSACADGSSTVTETSSATYGHQFLYTIGGLAAATRTYYCVTLDSQTAGGSFLNAPRADATDLTFYAYCDTRTNIAEHDAVAAQLLADIAAAPDERQTFIILCGDFVNYGLNEDGWTNEFFDPAYANLVALFSQVPIMGTIGNHESYVSPIDQAYEDAHQGELFRKYWPQPLYESSSHFYYSFDYGPLHAVAIDQYTASYSDTSRQYAWLDDDLGSSTKPWKVAAFHVPAYSANFSDEDSTRSQNTRTYLVPLFVQRGVDLVIQGHHHYYSRSDVNGVPYVLTGTGGAPFESFDNGVPFVVPGTPQQAYHFARFEISGGTMNVTVIDKDGNTIDQFSL